MGLDVASWGVMKAHERRVGAGLQTHDEVVRVAAEQQVHHRHVHVKHRDHCRVVDTPRAQGPVF